MGSKPNQISGKVADMDAGKYVPADIRTRTELREALCQHAYRRWREAVACFAKGEAPPKRDMAALRSTYPALARISDESLRMVERFAMGAAAEAISEDGTALGKIANNPGPSFDEQLELIVGGIIQRLGEEAPVAANAQRPRPQSFQAELWQVLHQVRESGDLSYAREIDLVELDRRIMFLLRRLGPLVPADLSASIGVDKAQVSRSVKRLLELRMIERTQIRSPVTLTRKGEALADRLLRLAELRNRELCFDISEGELNTFFSAIEILLDRAILLYEQERDRSDTQGEWKPNAEIEDRKKGERLAIDRSRIISPLLTLSAYFARSGTLTFKRMTGLSSFEAWVLAEVSKNPPTDWATLVRALQRDHSQAGRTVTSLIEKGLVEREGGPGRRHGRFSPTEKGATLFDMIHEAGLRRSNYLMSPLEPELLSSFLATFDKLRRNASAQLQREQAMEELDRR